MDVSTSAKSNIHGGMSSKRMHTSACSERERNPFFSEDDVDVDVTGRNSCAPSTVRQVNKCAVVRSSCALDGRNSSAIDGCNQYATALAACHPSMS
jgi:hypothetical protein